MTNSPTDAIEKLIEWHTDRLGLELRAQAKQARDQLERLKYLAHEHDRHHDTLCAVTSMLLNGAGCWTKELLVEAVRKREAELAAMRGALQRLYHSGEYLIANNHTERCIDGIGDLRDALANVRTSHALTSQAGADLLARMAALEADKRRLETLLAISDIEGKEGWCVTLDYDNYQDGARVINADGVVVAECYDIDKEPNEQFRAAIDKATALLSSTPTERPENE